MILINGTPETRINISDRGLQYGDGLFETIAYRQQQLELWPQHRARLMLGCERLKIPFSEPELALLENELQQILQTLSADTVIKIMVTRGEGGRGYRPDPQATATRIISTHPFPAYPDSHNSGIAVRWCQQILSQNPVLAGLKHLNRLEQVLARSEWDNTEITEGLMLNSQQQIIEGTMSNLFLVVQGQLITPDLTFSGVAGIMRATVMEIAESMGIAVQQRTISQPDILAADEVFLTNSLIRIWPVSHIDGETVVYQHGPITQQLQHALAGRLSA